MFGSIAFPMRRGCIALVTLCAVMLQSANTRAQNPISVRVGWQPTTTVEAQIAHVLQKTDILERNGLKGQFTMFSFGPAVNEALVSGAIDIGFVHCARAAGCVALPLHDVAIGAPNVDTRQA